MIIGNIWLTIILPFIMAIMLGLKLFDLIDYKIRKKKKNGNNKDLSK